MKASHLLFVSISFSPLALAQTQGCEIEVLSAAPASLKPGDLVSTTAIRVFREQQNVVLPANLMVDFDGDGWLINAPPTPQQSATIPQGTAVASWLLHMDSNGGDVPLRGTITFDKNILGIMVRYTTLNEFDRQPPAGLGLGAPGTLYSTNQRRDIEFDSLDNVAVSGRSLYVLLETPNFLDDLRVITEPNSSIVNVTCAISGCAGNSGCPCGNNASSSGSGCENSTSQGARLSLGGPNFVPLTSPALFDMTLVVIGLPANRNGLLAMSANLSPATVFGAGQSCLGTGPIYRIQVFSTGSGVVSGGNLIQGVNTLVQPPNLIVPGTTWTFQVLYRDPVGAGTCPASTANATNAVTVPFL